MRLKWFAFAETWNYSDCCIKAGTHQVLLWTLPWVLTVRYPSSGTNLLKLCLPTDIHLSPAILLQEAFWSVKHPVELPQDLLQPGCNWVASFLLRLLSSPGLFMTIPNQKHSAFQLRLDPIRRSELDRTRILTASFSISYNCSFHLFVFGIILVKPTGSARRLAIWRSHSADESSRRKGTSWLERSLVTGAACSGRCQTKKTSGRFGRSDVGVWGLAYQRGYCIGMIRSYSWAITSHKVSYNPSKCLRIDL